MAPSPRTIVMPPPPLPSSRIGPLTTFNHNSPPRADDWWANNESLNNLWNYQLTIVSIFKELLNYHFQNINIEMSLCYLLKNFWPIWSKNCMSRTCYRIFWYSYPGSKISRSEIIRIWSYNWKLLIEIFYGG